MVQNVNVVGLKNLNLGRQGENKAREIRIDCTALTNVFPGCRLEIAAIRPGERKAYLPEITQEGSIVSWLVRAEDTALAGKGQAEVRAILNKKIKKSGIFVTYISEAITAKILSVPPGLFDKGKRGL